MDGTGALATPVKLPAYIRAAAPPAICAFRLSQNRLHIHTACLGFVAFVASLTFAAAQTPTLTFLTGPAAAYRTLSAERDYEGIAELWDDAERPALLPEVGLRHSQRTGAKSSLSGSIFYSVLGYDYEQRNLRFGSQWNGTEFDPTLPSGEPLGVSPVVGHRFHYVTLTVEYAYTLRPDEHRFNISLRGGAEPGLLVGQYTRLRANDGSRYSRKLEADLQSFSVSLRASVSLTYRLTPDWSIVAEPNLRHQLTPLSSGNLRTRLNSAGVLVGVQRGL